MTQNEKKNHSSEDFTSSRPYLLHPFVFLCGEVAIHFVVQHQRGDKGWPRETRTRTVKGRGKTDMSWCITYEIYFICACTCGVCVYECIIYIYIYVYSACKH